MGTVSVYCDGHGVSILWVKEEVLWARCQYTVMGTVSVYCDGHGVSIL